MFLIIKFPIAAVTNHHKLGDLKTLKFILLQFWRQEVWIGFTGSKPRYLQDCASFRDSGRKFLFLPSQLLELKYLSSNLSLHAKSHHTAFSLCVNILPFCLLPRIRAILRPTGIIQDNLPISRFLITSAKIFFYINQDVDVFEGIIFFSPDYHSFPFGPKDSCL